jgi:N-glycosylase/DNA lyase
MAITIDNWIEADRRNFRHKKDRIRAALEELDTGMLDGITDQNKVEIFYMLCFCLIVPQSKQAKAEEAVDALKEQHFYDNDLSEEELQEILKGKVLYHNNKAKWLLTAKDLFLGRTFWPELKRRYALFLKAGSQDGVRILETTRDWLVRRVKGMGMKLSSHFLRNCGMRGLAILDVHVLRAMKKRGLVSAISPLTKARYCDIEREVKAYADRLGLNIDELDQLFWSSATGYVGK